MTFINILIVAIWKSRQAFRAYGWGNMPLQAVKLPISHNNVVGENTVLQLNILETGVLTLVVQNSSPTRLRLVGDELWTTRVRTPVSKMFRWRTYNSWRKSDFRRPFWKQKLCIDLKWREMRSKVIFAHPKWPKSDFQNGRRWPFWKKKKKKVAYWPDWSDFRSSKMAAGSHFVKTKIKVAYWSEMARNVIESDFRSSKMEGGGGITMACL